MVGKEIKLLKIVVVVLLEEGKLIKFLDLGLLLLGGKGILLLEKKLRFVEDSPIQQKDGKHLLGEVISILLLDIFL